MQSTQLQSSYIAIAPTFWLKVFFSDCFINNIVEWKQTIGKNEKGKIDFSGTFQKELFWTRKFLKDCGIGNDKAVNALIYSILSGSYEITY